MEPWVHLLNHAEDVPQGFGYLGLQQVEARDNWLGFMGTAIFSIWDSGCNAIMDESACPENQRAQIIECGEMAVCSRFGNQGTGQQSMIRFSEWTVEQTYGFSIFVVSLHIAAATVGLHVATAWLAALSWALFNVANHLAFDSLLHLPLPYPAYPRDHQMHHRFPQCNYSTLTTIMDRYFGSFRSYQAMQKNAKLTPQSLDRPEAVPSPYSVLGLGVGLAVAGVLAERVITGSLPSPAQASVFLPSSRNRWLAGKFQNAARLR